MMLSISSTALSRTLARTTRPATTTSLRGLAMKPREEFEELPPNFSMDSVQPPPHGIGESYEPDQDPMYYNRKPVTSAHSIDVSKGSISNLDSAAFGPAGTILHGRFGQVDAAAAATIPLEYLALLRPAAEGVAALREITEASKLASGTVLVYGASRPAGMTAVQLAASSGSAVVAVVDGQHSGNDEMVDVIKGLTAEPGFAVAEEYALCKANFRDLVQRTVSGDELTAEGFDSTQFLEDFKANLLDYTQTYPDDLPAAVDAEELKFVGKEKDRANFKANMSAYLSQFAPGAPPIDSAQLDANFTVDQYELFKKKFGIQTTAVISGGDGVTNTDRFAPGEIVANMIAAPETPEADQSTGDYPFEFSIKNFSPETTPSLKGGPIMGAIIEVTPELSTAAEAVSKAKTLRAKAEALQFLTEGERNAHAAASSVVSLARKAGAPIRTVGGSLPGLDAIQKPTDQDIAAALDAMAVGDDGSSRLNYFIQVYRAGDFPAYEDYAIHRATEPLAGPRQIVVTK
ncbi:hypothetical protein HJC23_003292 [Cyclotella cryptica]|uniref:Uncharacterized protein n=1 Tax=Cyclotella cryptica TaxID=29204 RepID=A0ABD3QYG4_9STRA